MDCLFSLTSLITCVCLHLNTSLSLSALQSQIHSWNTLFSGPVILYQHFSAPSLGKTPPQSYDVCHHPTEKRHLSFNINALTSMSFAEKGLWIILVPSPWGTVSNITAHICLSAWLFCLLFHCKIFDSGNVTWKTEKQFSLWKHCCSVNLSCPPRLVVNFKQSTLNSASLVIFYCTLLHDLSKVFLQKFWVFLQKFFWLLVELFIRRNIFQITI